LQKFDEELLSLNAKKCIFRIYRDVRFSRDKSPYKTNLGAYFVKGGKKSGFAGYYIHIEPGNSFAAGGMHMPPTSVLRQVRSEIYNHIDEFKSILFDPEFIARFGSLEGEKLKSTPPGFNKDFPDIELLKFKSYTVFSPLSDHQITQRGFIKELIPTYKMMLPLNRFLNGAIR
jgi:uncharacterized protein (TIGR02453 family)